MFLKQQDIHLLKQKKGAIDIVQINLGNKCNQSCIHCHMAASPHGDKNMDYETAAKVIQKLEDLNLKCIEFTGGAPELNPNLSLFIERLSGGKAELAVRTNLTILNEAGYSSFIDLFVKHRVKIIASLPSPFMDLTDMQRGNGTFASSIKVLQKLNQLGYGTGKYYLELVHNPVGDHLPSDQALLNAEYKRLLLDNYGISFDSLVTIVNSPIKRFENYLIKNKRLDGYMRELQENYNPATLNKIMCRHLISVNYKGCVYDCDFNLALNMKINGYEDIKFWDIDFGHFDPEITFGSHCYACTVKSGSSCHGALIDAKHDSDIKRSVRQYYGSTLKDSTDLKTSACCNEDSLPDYVREVMPYIADEIKMKHYGCGSPIPMPVNGLRVLDLGCGTGRDCYVLSKLVGQEGFVYGIDMTAEQIEVAERYLSYQMGRFGYKDANIRFIYDYIENLNSHFSKDSLDLVISNCVLNLVEDKEAVLRQIYRILKEGGELYFSDVYADRRVPAHLKKDPVLYGECLSGSLYLKDFERLSRKAGFADPRIMSIRNIDITNKKIKASIGNINFYSVTYRLWKLSGLEDTCEDYGHIAVYKGGIAHSPFSFKLDSGHIFEKNKPERVCGNTALMLSQTRLKRYFEVVGDFSEHFGAFKDSNNLENKHAKPKRGECAC